jgi:cardiolipin synthase A/B
VKPDYRRWFRASRTALVGRNEVALLQGGTEFFPALLEAIAGATREVRLETYIYADDETGRRVADALSAAARRGVAVSLLVDGFGTRQLAPDISENLREAGVDLRIYAPVRLLTLNRARLRRLHRKLACIDGNVAFVGGINILDDLWDPNHGALEYPRLDYAARLQGPIVADVRSAMTRLWRLLAQRDLAKRLRGMRPPATDPSPPGARRADDVPTAALPPASSGPGGVKAMLVLRDNLAFRRSIERAYLKAIGTARREVLIANAYFFPGRRFRRALVAAASRGVRVRLLLQGLIEYPVPHYAARALYDELLHAGVEIVEYHRSFLHAKVAVIDDWATVGSSNIDPFSLLLAREANLVVLDRDFAQALRERLLASMAEGGMPVAMTQHARRPWLGRLLDWMSYRLLRLGVVVTGSRSRY